MRAATTKMRLRALAADVKKKFFWDKKLLRSLPLDDRVQAMKANPDPASAGARMRRRRQALNISQAELAAHSRVTPETISRWEVGATSPSVDDLAAVLAALGCTPAEFWSDAPPPCPVCGQDMPDGGTAAGGR